jgi:hypothetical protein
MRVNHPHTKTVFQYASDQITFIAKYDSIRQAATLTGISTGYLTRCLNQGNLVHGKLFFSFTVSFEFHSTFLFTLMMTFLLFTVVDIFLKNFPKTF